MDYIPVFVSTVVLSMLIYYVYKNERQVRRIESLFNMFNKLENELHSFEEEADKKEASRINQLEDKINAQDLKLTKHEKELLTLKLEVVKSPQKQDADSEHIKELDTEQIKELEHKIRTQNAKIIKQEKELTSFKDEKVAVTSCVSIYRTWSSGQVIIFDEIVTKYKIADINNFKTSGKFTCESKGVYFIGVNVRALSNMSNSGKFYIYRNGQAVSGIHIASFSADDGWSYTGTGIVTLYLKTGDKVWIQAGASIYVAGYRFSCLTIVKL